MPRVKTKIENNTFVKGLITEAGPLTFPDNASLVDENFVLNRDGSRQRRLGLDYESGYVKKTVSSIESLGEVVSSYTWKSVRNEADLDIAVLQLGTVLYFYDVTAGTVSANILNGGSSFNPTYTTAGVKFDFSTVNGDLVVATGHQSVTVLTYDRVGDVISDAITPYSLIVRDTFGVEEIPNIAVDFRPITLSNTHYYNLRNQGWPLTYKCYDFDGVKHYVKNIDPVTHSFTHNLLTVFNVPHFYPSNADILQFMTTANPTSVIYTTGNPLQGSETFIGSYDPSESLTSLFGTTHAPRGQYLIDAFNRGNSRATLTGLAGIKLDQTLGGVTAVASYAGRMFYGLKEEQTIGTDDNSPSLGSMILYSQVVGNHSDLPKCHSDNDPTSEDINDILDTDGGFIKIDNMGEVFKFIPLGESLFIFASKGVWEISGGDNYFSATNQTITKTTDFGAISGDSVVEGETGISFWSSGGIYLITIDPTSLKGVTVNITQNTIQSFYDDIPTASKETVTGIFDDVSKQIRWLYRDISLESVYYYNKELVFDTNLSSFYSSYIQDLDMATGSSPYVIGYIATPTVVFTDESEQVVAGSGGDVQVNGEDVLVTLRVSDQSTEGSLKYWSLRDLGTGSAELTAASYSNLDFLDWEEETDTLGESGKDAPAVLLTGYTTDGDSTAIKKSKYITVLMRRTETGFTDDGSGNLTPVGESSCIMQGQWEWTNSEAAGRWSSEKEVYRLPRAYVPTGAADPFDYSFTVVKTKNKVRGKGSALSLLFKSSAGKDLHLYGWSREVTVPEE